MPSTSKKNYYQVVTEVGEVVWNHLTQQEATDKAAIYSTPKKRLHVRRVRKS